MDELSLFPHSNGNHSSNDNDSEIFDEEENEQPIDEIEPQQPIPNVRGGRRKGVPRRLQLSPDVIKPPIQRLLPLANTKVSTTNIHHHHYHQQQQQSIVTSDQDEDDNDIENLYQSNEHNYLQLDFVDKNNNHEEVEDILEIVDDILADIVTIIVKDVKQQRQKSQKYSITNGKTHSKAKFTDLTKTMQMNSSQTQVKHKLSPCSSPSSTKRQKTVETNNSAALQHQQLLWEMTQQLMMSSGMNETENSSLLKQQLLGLNQVESKRANPRPSKPQSQSPNPTSPLPFERNNFAPRRRGRPPKYVTDRNLPGLSGLDLDPSSLSTSYDQLFAAIENGINPNVGGASAAAFQTALASMLGQQAAALSIPPPPAARNGVPASMVKSSAGQTRHSLPAATKLPQDIGGTSGLDIPLLATKKRGPGRPPKSQMLFDPHQILQATQRLNSPTHNNYPPTMVPSSPNSFNLNAAFVEMLQQQQQH